ncbi:MAG: hypothetical protein R3Y39_07110 [Rikenellaceae bacterium]
MSINALFKFITPIVCDFSLSRTEEMVVGVTIPFILLLFFELYQRSRNFEDPNIELCRKAAEKKREEERTEALQMASSESNESKQSLRVIGLGIMLTGVVITLLGAISADDGQGIVITVGVLLALLGFVLFRKK